MSDQEARKRVDSLNENSIAYLLLLDLPKVVQLYAMDCCFRHGGRVLLCPDDKTDERVLPMIGEIFRLEREFRDVPPETLRLARRLLGIGVFWPTFRDAMTQAPAAFVPPGHDPLRDLAVLAVDALLNIADPLPVGMVAPWYQQVGEFIRRNLYMVGRPWDNHPWLACSEAVKAYGYIQRNPGHHILPRAEYVDLLTNDDRDELLKRSEWYCLGIKSVNPDHQLQWERPPRDYTPRQTNQRDADYAALHLDVAARINDATVVEAREFNVAAAFDLSAKHAVGKRWGSMTKARQVSEFAGHPHGTLPWPARPDEAFSERIIKLNDDHLQMLRQQVKDGQPDTTKEKRENLMKFIEKFRALLGAWRARKGAAVPMIEAPAIVVDEAAVLPEPTVPAVPAGTDVCTALKGCTPPRGRDNAIVMLPPGRSIFELRDYRPDWIYKLRPRSVPWGTCQHCGEYVYECKGPRKTLSVCFVRNTDRMSDSGDTGRYYVKHACSMFPAKGSTPPQFTHDNIIGWGSHVHHISAVVCDLDDYLDILEREYPGVEDEACTFTGQFSLGTSEALELLRAKYNADVAARLVRVRAEEERNPLDAGYTDRGLFQKLHDTYWLAESLRWCALKLLDGLDAEKETRNVEKRGVVGGLDGSQKALGGAAPAVPEVPAAAV